MSDHDDRTPEERFAELERLIAEQDHQAEINDKSAAIVARVLRFWNIDLRGRATKFYELDDERVAAMVDGSMMFEIVGEDLHLVEPLGETGMVACYVVEPDGHYYLAASADDPTRIEER